MRPLPQRLFRFWANHIMLLDFHGASEHPILSAKPKLLFVGDAQSAAGAAVADQLRQAFEVVPGAKPAACAGSPRARVVRAASTSAAEHLGDAFQSASCCRTSGFSKACPTASSCSTATTRSSGATAGCASGPSARASIGANFYTVLGSPEILGPDFCPFHTALATRPAEHFDACARATTATSRCTPRRSSTRRPGRRST